VDAKVAILAGAAGLAGLAFIATRNRGGDEGEASQTYGADPYGDLGGFGQGAAGAGDGWGGETPSAGSGAGAFSPEFEAELAGIARQDASNAAQARTRDNAIQAAGLTAFAVPVAIGGGLALSKALSARAATPAARMASIRTSPGLAARAGTGIRAVAASTGGAVAAGVGLGLAGVAVLEHTGALNALGRATAKATDNAPKAVVATIKNVALPVTIVGGAAKAIVGKDTIAGNYKAAVKGTVLQNANVGNFRRGLGKLFGGR
jgi:hypothetical protein